MFLLNFNNGRPSWRGTGVARTRDTVRKKSDRLDRSPVIRHRPRRIYPRYANAIANRIT